MPDGLTHVLAGFTIATLLSFRYDWLRAPCVTLVMLGAISPDIAKIALVLDDVFMESLIGIPFSWRPLHTLGGNLLVIGLGALLVPRGYRKRAFLLLTVGAGSHFVLDLLLLKASGHAFPVFWPLTEYRPPAGMLYRSSDRLPALVAGSVAALVWIVRRQTIEGNAESG